MGTCVTLLHTIVGYTNNYLFLLWMTEQVFKCLEKMTKQWVSISVTQDIFPLIMISFKYMLLSHL